MTNKLNVSYAGHLIESEQIVVPASSPYKVRTVHNKIKKEAPSVVEIWQNSDKTGTQLVEEEYTGTVSATGKFQVDYEGVNDGDIRYCNTIVFHSGQAGQTFYVWYKTMGDIVDANDFNAKADKVVGGTENNLAALDATGNLKDAQKKVSDFEPVITPKRTAFNKDFGATSGTVCEGNDSRLSNPRTPTAHSSTHITGGTDIIPNAVAGGNSGLMTGADKQNLDDAAAKKHTQGTDTTLGNMTANINMNSHKLTNLAAPSAAGDSIRQTTKITEVNLEDAVDKKHKIYISTSEPSGGSDGDVWFKYTV